MRTVLCAALLLTAPTLALSTTATLAPLPWAGTMMLTSVGSGHATLQLAEADEIVGIDVMEPATGDVALFLSGRDAAGDPATLLFLRGDGFQAPPAWVFEVFPPGFDAGAYQAYIVAPSGQPVRIQLRLANAAGSAEHALPGWGAAWLPLGWLAGDAPSAGGLAMADVGWTHGEAPGRSLVFALTATHLEGPGAAASHFYARFANEEGKLGCGGIASQSFLPGEGTIDTYGYVVYPTGAGGVDVQVEQAAVGVTLAATRNIRAMLVPMDPDDHALGLEPGDVAGAVGPDPQTLFEDLYFTYGPLMCTQVPPLA